MSHQTSDLHEPVGRHGVATEIFLWRSKFVMVRNILYSYLVLRKVACGPRIEEGY